MLKRMNKIMDPTRFQGTKNKEYFEGWYFKLVSKDRKTVMAIIPGISKGENEECSFIQVFTSNDDKNYYIKYETEDFSYKEGPFNVQIKNNFFQKDKIEIDIDEKELKAKGSLHFKNLREYPSNLVRPNIMGPYSFAPFMECSHAVVSMIHTIEGELEINGKVLDFNEGTGYIEKDWGTSFPSEWIWMQSNSFKRTDAAFMLSVAKIPWLTGEFVGLIGFFSIKDSNLLFSTYNKNTIKNLKYENNILSLEVIDKDYTIQIEAKNKGGTPLKAPQKGGMERIIKESLDSEIKIRVIGNKEGLLYEDTGFCAGLEISPNYYILGDID